MSRQGTEAPTPRRLREARERGQVARSPQLGGALVLLGAGLATAVLVPSTARALLDLARRLWSTPEAAADPALHAALAAVARAAGPWVALAAGIGLTGAVLQTGLVLSPRALSFDVRRLDPVSGFRRLVSFERLGMVVKGTLALTIAAGVAWAVARPHLADLARLPLAEAGVGPVLAVLLGRLLAAAGAALLALGALDLALARRRLERSLRMTRQEVRDEHKREEGDPQHKGRRRREHRRMTEAPARSLKEATVVVINPTHVAVALHYAPGQDAPEVGVRGVDEAAARIRAEARRLGIPLVRNVPLARALLAVDPGEPVPEPLYQATAAVLIAVYRARSRLASRSLR